MRPVKPRVKTSFAEYLGRSMNSGSLGQNRISGNNLWYSQRFGGDYPQLQSAKDGIDRYLIADTCIGLDVETSEVYAPNGLADTEQGLLRINPKNPKLDLFDQKVKSYQARWPWLRIVDPQS